MVRFYRMIALFASAAMLVAGLSACTQTTSGTASGASVKSDVVGPLESDDPMTVAEAYEAIANEMLKSNGMMPMEFLNVVGEDAWLEQMPGSLGESIIINVEALMAARDSSLFEPALNLGTELRLQQALVEQFDQVANMPQDQLSEADVTEFLSAFYDGEIWPWAQQFCYGGASVAFLSSHTGLTMSDSDIEALEEAVAFAADFTEIDGARNVLSRAYESGLKGDLKSGVCDDKFDA